jgi:transcriptional regulator with XRE-family HTH domain
MGGTINEQKVNNQISDVLEKIIYRRKRLGLSQSELAKKLKVTLSGYYKMETGKTKLDIRRLLELSEILKVKINYFLSEENN